MPKHTPEQLEAIRNVSMRRRMYGDEIQRLQHLVRQASALSEVPAEMMAEIAHLKSLRSESLAVLQQARQDALALGVSKYSLGG